jgi:hypothetical protein
MYQSSYLPTLYILDVDKLLDNKLKINNNQYSINGYVSSILNSLFYCLKLRPNSPPWSRKTSPKFWKIKFYVRNVSLIIFSQFRIKYTADHSGRAV